MCCKPVLSFTRDTQPTGVVEVHVYQQSIAVSPPHPPAFVALWPKLIFQCLQPRSAQSTNSLGFSCWAIDCIVLQYGCGANTEEPHNIYEKGDHTHTHTQRPMLNMTIDRCGPAALKSTQYQWSRVHREPSAAHLELFQSRSGRVVESRTL